MHLQDTLDHRTPRPVVPGRIRWAGASLFALTLALAAGQAAAAEAPADADAPQDFPAQSVESGSGDGIGEVVVTARRRKERLQDVPIPISVVNGDALANAGTVRMEDIGRLLPSTNVTVNNPRQNSIAIRGLGNNPASDGLEPSAGVFLDGVYLSRPGMAVFDLSDVDQLELLRGPQGTLFGKNTTAGAINITTKKPSFTPEFTAEGTYGNYNDREFRGTATGPLTDTQAVRLSLYSSQRDGTLKNLTTGGDQLDRNRQGVRGQWLYDDKERLSLRFIAEYHHEHDAQGVSTPAYRTIPGSGYWAYLNKLRADGATVNLPNQGYNPFDRHVYSDGLQDMKVDQGGASLEGNLKLGGGYTLTSISAFRQWNFSPYNDGDLTNLPLVVSAGAQNHTGQVSEELRLASPVGGLFDYTGGLFFYSANTLFNQYTRYGTNATLLSDFFGSYNYTTGVLTPNVGLANTYAGKMITQRGQLGTDSYAGFFQGNLHPTDDLTLTGGTRYTFEHKTISIYRETSGQTTALGNATLNSFNLALLLAANYKVNDDLNLFVTGSHGAKAGAMNNLLPTGLPLTRNNLVVAPEKVNEIDLGFKSQFLDKKVHLDANLFYGLVQDYQATGQVYNSATGGTSASLINTGWVVTRGVEVDASVRPFPGLKLSAGGSYNLATYRSYRQGACAAEDKLPTSATCDLTGRRVQGAPRWIGTLSAEYDHEFVEGVESYVGADYQYRSFAFGTSDNSQYGRIEAYGLVNLRLGSRFDDDRFDVSVWVRNLLDQNYVVSTSGGGGNGAFGAYAAQLGDPRTFGLTTRIKF